MKSQVVHMSFILIFGREFLQL